ncbi:MAG: alanine racemase [Clostridia bacterium]|nr:alanine racemase [Clostridia bacterium]
MSEVLRDTYVQVDLGAIAGNMEAIREMVGPDCAVMPVIKANAYGLGAVGVARTLLDHGACYLAVATLTEALELREAYPEAPLFILGHTPDRFLHIVVEKKITQTLFTAAQGKLLSDIAAEHGVKAKVHLKVDTGFHRLGTEDVDALYSICMQPNIEVEGIFSHLALAGEEEDAKQYRRFIAVIEALEAKGVTFRYKHLADSIAAVDYPEYRMNMVRPGALVYGLRGFHKGYIEVKQSMAFHTHLSQVREIPKGEGVGYDFLWRAPQDTRIGTVPFGYADGYPRAMRGKGYVTIHGVKCPLIGVLCMDQCMVDLTNVPDAKEGDLAIVYGDGSNNTMSIQEASELAGSNKNEIVARLLPRPPRVYING